MSKLVIKTVVFCSIILVVLFGLSIKYGPAHEYMNTLAEYRSIVKEGKEIDIAVYGSSHAFSSYNPRIIDSITHTRSFNFGNDAQRMVVTKYVLRETLKEISPKLVVVDMYVPSIKNPEGDRPFAFQKYSYDYFALSLNKINSVLEVFPREEIANTLLPVLRRKDFRPKRTQEVDIMTNTYSYKGFREFEASMKPGGYPNMEKSLKIVPNVANNKFDALDDSEKENIEIAIKSVIDNGAKVLIVVAPFFSALKNKDYPLYHNYVKSLCKSNNLQFIDFNLLWEELDLGFLDFRDAGHLNLKGANKVSTYLANYIDKNYQLPSRKGDPEWINEQPKTLKTYISSDFEKESVKVNKQLLPTVKINSIGFMKEGSSKKCIIELSNILIDTLLNSYRLGFHTYVHKREKERLSAYSKTKERDYDAWDFNPELTHLNGKKYIIKRITTPINQFKKIKLFLYDRKGYKRVVGKTIEIEEITIK